jgi:hypothetical protein
MAARKSGGRRYGRSASKKVASAMRRRKKGTLRSGRGGKGGKVKSRKQAIAIGLSEAREAGGKVPARRKSSSKRAGAKKSTRKSTARKSTARKSTARKSTARKSTARKSTTKRSTAKKSARKASR